MKASEYSGTYSFEYDKHPDAVYFSAKRAPIKIYGLYKPCEGEHFIRMPEDVARATSQGVYDLNYNTSGGRLTFSTDSPYIALHAIEPTFYNMPHMPRSGNAGFDVYECDENGRQSYSGSLLAPAKSTLPYFADCDSRTTLGKMKNYVINFPLYEHVDEVYIGVAPDARIESFDGAYTNDAPIVFYGSSITQGGCVCRPGNAYPSYISRRFRRDFINLGFSGSGKAEPAIVDYMATLDMSIFVCDYDHNAPTVEYLENTHFALYEKIRAAHPDVPYVMISKPDTIHHPDYIERREVIRRSYERALGLGDKNVYFIDGETLLAGDCADACTVDTTHPNDLGHYRMGARIGDVIEKIIKKAVD